MIDEVTVTLVGSIGEEGNGRTITWLVKESDKFFVSANPDVFPLHGFNLPGDDYLVEVKA